MKKLAYSQLFFLSYITLLLIIGPI